MDFEKLGAFYLGKEYDVAAGKLLDRLLMYEARDLTTHAVCVGMTGSGKTGLGIDLLEEAAIDHVPAIIIDPKGDITNLLLNFPELRPEDFQPWINVDDARRRGLSEEEFAAAQAQEWKEGLAEWGQGTTRLLLLREAADFVIYTPGSDAGIPVSILRSFAAPRLNWDEDAELLRELIQGTVSALLGLIGVDADPVRSREHILLANLFEYYWRQGEDLDIPKLINAIQNPPLRQLGVFDVNTFFPEKERFKLAMAINNLIAAPAFQTWIQGQPLDVAGFLATPAGRLRHSIFYIAHLSDAERMFFVSMLLNQVVTWMRSQPGTTSLRALLYMDEIFGFFPPVANPPSKLPMLTLLKQARAYGLGVVLSTQNPADLDYKGLANAGSWFIGRLRTEQDKRRLLDGLENAFSASGQGLNRETFSSLISNLQDRTFLLHSVYEEAPVVFQTRWAMSYLRGPLTRKQIRTLMQGRKPDKVETPVPARVTAPPSVTVLAPGVFPEEEPVALSVASPSAQQVPPAEPEPVPVRKRPAAPPLPEPESEPEPFPIRMQPAAVQPASEEDEVTVAPPPRQAPTPPKRAVPSETPDKTLLVSPPPVPSGIQQVFLPVRRAVEAAVQAVQSREGVASIQGRKRIYVPALLGVGTVDFGDRQKKVQAQEKFALLAPPGGIGREVWERAQPVELGPHEVAGGPEAGSYFVKLPGTMDESVEFSSLKKALEDFLYYNWDVTVFYCPALEVYSAPDESQRDFRARLQQLAREKRDEELDEIQAYYEDRLAKLDERLRRAESALARKEADAHARSQEAWVSIGESIFRVLGRRRSYRPLSTYMSKRRMADTKAMEAQEAQDSVGTLEEQVAAMEDKIKQEAEEVRNRWDTALDKIEEVLIKPRRTDVHVELFALAWTPYWGITFQGGGGLRSRLVAAF